MKKIISLLVIAICATTATYAQDAKSEKKSEMKAEMPKNHECYAMKEGMLQHCTGDQVVPQKSEVTLKNGTTITPDGVVKTKDGSETKLEDGQCITMMGSIGDCEKMHAMSSDHMDMEKSEDMK